MAQLQTLSAAVAEGILVERHQSFQNFDDQINSIRVITSCTLLRMRMRDCTR